MKSLALSPISVKNPVITLLVHYLVWELIYMLMGLPIVLSAPTRNWGYFFFNYGLIGSINFLIFYITAFYFIPAFFVRKRRVALLTTICFATAMLFTYLKYETELTYFANQLSQIKPLIKKGKPFPSIPLRPPTLGSYFRSYLWFSFIMIIIALAYQLLLMWYKQEKIRKDLETQQLKTELSFLKLQINPHFLFNALNNIYSMAILEKSNKTGDGIMKLSELIRYMLYEKEDEYHRVSLEKEIKHINSFIDLQKLRHEGDVHIAFSIEGDITGKRIPSLLLFPLIENSCKHGLLQDPQKPICIHLAIRDKELHFTIHNFKNYFLKDNTGGIGLANVRKRLALLFPKTHTLNINETGTDFRVQLTLPL